MRLIKKIVEKKIRPQKKADFGIKFTVKKM
ncbi:hypothetical protein BSF42_22000 [Flavobacterium sp. ACN6]|nr:hypothetical protein BSF42_22000 [Flavobacterium sp. ACN6]